MAIINYIRKMFKKSRPGPSVEYVRDETDLPQDSVYHADSVTKSSVTLDKEIDLSRRADLEDYAKDINMSKESIERWISSGLLMPEELKIAEKLIKIMRKK